MSEEFTVGKGTVSFEGIFSLKDYYKLLYELLRGIGYDIQETKHDLEAGAKEKIDIEWECKKKVDDYAKFVIKVIVEIRNLEQVQVKSGDTVYMKNKGSVLTFMKGKIVTDYENKWETKALLKFLKGIYDAYIYKPTFDMWKGKLSIDLQTVDNELKAFFNMQRFM